MFQPYRGSAVPYTAQISATSLHDGGANPCYMSPSGSLVGGPKISLGQANASAIDTDATRYVRAYEEAVGMPTRHSPSPRPVQKDQRTPAVTELDLENAGILETLGAEEGSPWILIAIGTFIMMMAAGR